MVRVIVRAVRLALNAASAGLTVFVMMCALNALEASAAEAVASVLNPQPVVAEPAATPATPPDTTAVVVPGGPAVTIKSGVRTMAPIPDTSAQAADAAPARSGLQSEKHCLATAIYFEARGESAKGQKAVAEVVLARTRVPGRPKTICGVVYEGSQRKTGCQFSFTCDAYSDVARRGKAWTRAQRTASAVMRLRGRGKVVGGATFYHADYVNPGWASRMVKVAQIGSHIFYRPKRGRYF